MSQRHPVQNGLIMFVTTNIVRGQHLFADPARARIAVETLYTIQDYYPFWLYGFVIMPNHIHLLLEIAPGGSISKTIGIYKRAVTFNIGQGPLWQPRFHMRMPGDAQAVLHYIHMNPVLKRLCEEPEDYPWSSASGRWDVRELVSIYDRRGCRCPWNTAARKAALGYGNNSTPESAFSRRGYQRTIPIQ